MKRVCWLLLVFAACANGCAALTNPVADGIPVRRLPDEVLARPKTELYQVPLNLLRINEPGEYKLDKGDVLGIVADGILTSEQQPIPVQFVQNPNSNKTVVQGVPVPVQEDGTITLPVLPPINVRGMTVPQAREALLKAIEKTDFFVKDRPPRVTVDLMQPRRYRVLVVREDNQFPQYAAAGGAASLVGGSKRGAAFSLQLEPGHNDVLQALTQTGGPPGLEAKNEIVIRRGTYDPANPAKGYVRIPLRGRVDQPLTFTQEDITLNEGDTVSIEARDTEVYYTAGLLGSSQVALPRDYDLRVTEAITQVRGPLINGGFSQNAFVANSTGSGIGNPSPSLVTVVRRLPNLQQILIRVDLNEAFRDLRENIIIMPGDMIVLQERPSEAMARYFTQTFRLNTTWELIRGNRFLQIATSNNP